MMIRKAWSTLFLLSVLMGSGSALGEKVTLEMWLRKAGTNGVSDVKSKAIAMDLTGLALNELNTYDIQYEKNVKVRGIHLRDLIALYKPIPEHVDVINLYTKSGMIIPVSIGRLRQDVEIFVATTIFENSKWTAKFPESVRIEQNSPKVIPVVFNGAKVVVGKDWRATENGFTPWRYMDTLVGIEFVESSAYAEQFRHKTAERKALQGRIVFLGSCYFCHGAGGLGAHRAPDLLAIIDPKSKDAAQKILNKVLNPGGNRVASHFMPEQKDFSERNAKDLISWIGTLEKGKMNEYSPSYGK